MFDYPLGIMRVGDKGKFIFPQLQSNGDPVIIEIELLNTLTEKVRMLINTSPIEVSAIVIYQNFWVRFAVTSANPTGESLTAGKKCH